MLKKVSAGNSEKAPAYPELEKQRVKLAAVVAQLKELDSKLEEAFAVKREHEARRDSVLIMAEALLEGDSEALPQRDVETEIKNLLEKRAVLAKAVELQQGRVDEASREASSAEYKRLKPKFVTEIKRLVGAVESYQSAVETMTKIREEITAAGLRDVFPPIAWPGLKPGDYQRQREAFHYKLELSGLGEALK